MSSEFVLSFTHIPLQLPETETRRALITTYAHSLDLYLSQALNAESEADYWARVERSTVALCVYYGKLISCPFLCVSYAQIL